MIPGIYYLYEYKNEQRLRNVGFFKITQHYHTCILKINVRRISIPSDGIIKLFVFYGENSDNVSQEIAEIPCEEENISANLSVSDSMFPEGRTLEAMDGFFLRTVDGEFYGAVSNEASFDTRKIRNWEESEPPLKTEIPPAAETEGQYVSEEDEELAIELGVPPATGTGTPPTRNNVNNVVPPATGTGAPPTINNVNNVVPPATGTGTPPTRNNVNNVVPPATGTGAPPTRNNVNNVVPPATGTGAPPTRNNVNNMVPPATGTGAPPTRNTGTLPVTEPGRHWHMDTGGQPVNAPGEHVHAHMEMETQPVPEPEEQALIDIGVPPVTEIEEQSDIRTEGLPDEIEECITGVSHKTEPQQDSESDAASQANTDSTKKTHTKNSENVRKIQRSELSVLPRRYWNIANNSFLMHGYHNYHHLMLVESDGHYWIGVPGIYTTREARAAELFGFPQFTKSHVEHLDLTSDERDENSNFGHWCRYMM